MKVDLTVEKIIISGHPFVYTEARVGKIVIHKDQFDGNDIFLPLRSAFDFLTSNGIDRLDIDVDELTEELVKVVTKKRIHYGDLVEAWEAEDND